MGGGLVQLFNSDEVFTSNPQDGEPFWGYRSKSTLYSNPYCPTLEYSHLDTGDLKLAPRSKILSDDYELCLTRPPKSISVKSLDSLNDLDIKERFLSKTLSRDCIFLSRVEEDTTEIDKSMVTDESIDKFKLEMKTKEKMVC